MFKRIRKVLAVRKIRQRNSICHLASCRSIVRMDGFDNIVDSEAVLPKAVRLNVCGNRNRIRFGAGLNVSGRLEIRVIGDDNEIVIGRDVRVINRLVISMIKGVCHGSVRIGNQTTFWNTTLKDYDNGSSLEIGSDGMFSWDTEVCNTDEHAILLDGKVCNTAGKLSIGNHVWMGCHAAVMKNSVIPDNCIVGRSAVVSGCFEEPGIVLAGVPARAVKRGINWSRLSPNEMVEGE